MLSIEEKILTLNSLRLLPVAALRFPFYALRFLPVPFTTWFRSSVTQLFHDALHTNYKLMCIYRNSNHKTHSILG